MSAKLQKWGNSLGVRIPKKLAKEAKLGENSEVEIQQKNGNIIIMPVQVKYELSDLLSKITRANLHKEDDFAVEGHEAW